VRHPWRHRSFSVVTCCDPWTWTEPTVDDHRLTTVMGVARAVLATVGPSAAVRALLDEYGWDRTFQALALLRGPDAGVAFGLVWEALLLDQTEHELRGHREVREA